MTHDPDPPSIDTLLKGSQWEERVARARVRREQVLAAKAAGFEVNDASAPTTSELETFVRRNPAPPSTPQARKRPVLPIAGGVAVGMVMSGLAIWFF